MLKSVFLGYARFTTSDKDPEDFHFISKYVHSKQIKFRVFPTSPINITFSNARNISNHTVTFELSASATKLIVNETSIEIYSTPNHVGVKFGKLNDYNIQFTTTNILFNGKISARGHFQELRFIRFASVGHVSWTVEESKLQIV